ncbi:MAG: hypothetical protein JW829_19445, partial [Pirellulales bacterium]|nr:hypothetical protein [Pirellulales bacterium]
MRNVSRFFLAFVVLFAMSVAPAVLAGTIPPVPGGVISISGPGLGNVAVPVILTPSPANDNQPSVPPADNNITVPVKRFDNVGYIDIEFAVVPDNGVTEYYVFESVDNNTGIDWSSYVMELGFYDANKNFVPSV